ncbi:2-phosphosulfolactate phosphatase [Aromatoleum petrolei]|uniref:Probable 2-phosphosulfolactate phosphatase n=1 Tax=Aromatoleum petrolei TaxID=76116 RepID=A0ABX1MWF2_9RHOO|nr:2-phosphosulfolactate phosphatase [Aromatoleum petrolei]NMF90656.1 2-phosphosulfolactate phosphatase [Aromatoleum petrolei]QTQ38762.1 2-phosphosulfolactate phosphatase [Aromatoleum petrolei]
MQIFRVALNRLVQESHDFDAVVAIDVLRSFSTAAYAFAAGASEIHPVGTAAEAELLLDLLPDALTVGALPGGRPMPGFDLGNSPARVRELNLRGRPVILSTAAGVQALLRFRSAPRLFAASLVCAGATLRALRAAAPKRVALITTGEWIDRDGDEDIACADYLAAGLQGERIDGDALARRVRDSDFGRRFIAGNDPALPLADLDLCAQVDRFDFAMPVTRGHHGLVMRVAPERR